MYSDLLSFINTYNEARFIHIDFCSSNSIIIYEFWIRLNRLWSFGDI